MKEEIKNIILEYCEGISHLEFDADKLDEIADRIEELSKFHQPTVISSLPSECLNGWEKPDYCVLTGSCKKCL